MKRLIIIFILGTLIFITLISVSSQKIEYGNNFSNSYFSDLKKDCKTAMIIVPHQDDEINVAGAMIKNLVENQCNVIVVFATNGDQSNQGKKRILEGFNSCKVLGVKESNIFFLGFGDTWNQSKYKHIYHAPGNEPMTSFAGYKSTYGISNHPDYATRKYGKPCIYTRNNFLKSIKDIITDYLPDQIYCVDFDAHPDHRAVSLLFEEALCQILKSRENYTPEVYKGFAYSTAWLAIDDFYNINLYSTKRPSLCHLQNQKYETDVPQYNWKDRVRFPVSKDILTHSISRNPISKALLEHKTPRAFGMAPKIINSDEVFWYRPTNSIVYSSQISASSGNANYLNDFKLFDCKDITKTSNAEYQNCLWLPDTNDKKKEVTIKLNKVQDINQICLYDNFDLNSNILSGIITFSDNSLLKIGPLNSNGVKTCINFPTKKNISYFKFKIISYEGNRPGLSEIEAFSPNRKKQCHFIKIVDKDNDMFIYRFFVEKYKKEELLDIYQYPDFLDYNIRIINQAKSKAHLVHHKILFEEGFKYCKVRVELKNNPQIYDEVEFVKLNTWDIFVYNCIKFGSKMETNSIKIYNKIID